jgi:hypothetical protein
VNPGESGDGERRQTLEARGVSVSPLTLLGTSWGWTKPLAGVYRELSSSHELSTQVWEPATRASESSLDLGTWIYGLAAVTPHDMDRVLVACTGGMYPVPDFLLRVFNTTRGRCEVSLVGHKCVRPKRLFRRANTLVMVLCVSPCLCDIEWGVGACCVGTQARGAGGQGAR